MMALACKPSVSEMGTAEPWGMLTGQPSLIIEPQVSVRDYLKIQGWCSWKTTPMVDFWTTHTHTHPTIIYTLSYTYLHMHTHFQIHICTHIKSYSHFIYIPAHTYTHTWRYVCVQRERTLIVLIKQDVSHPCKFFYPFHDPEQTSLVLLSKSTTVISGCQYSMTKWTKNCYLLPFQNVISYIKMLFIINN